MGLRDLVPSIDFIPLKKVEMVFDLTGDDERANKTKKVVVRNKSANIFESIVLDVPIPINHLYAPVLTIYCYDHVLGFVR